MANAVQAVVDGRTNYWNDCSRNSKEVYSHVKCSSRFIKTMIRLGRVISQDSSEIQQFDQSLMHQGIPHVHYLQ